MAWNCTDLFPKCRRATADIQPHGGVRVILSYLDRAPEFVTMDPDKIANFLEQVRREQARSKQ